MNGWIILKNKHFIEQVILKIQQLVKENKVLSLIKNVGQNIKKVWNSINIYYQKFYF